MSCGSKPRSTASPACRWSCARRVGAYDAAAARFTVYTSAGGGVIRQRDDIAGALGVAKDAVRVVSGDVGGNFGIRNNTCPEFVLVAWAAKRVGRPVKWVCDRRDAFLDRFSRPRPDFGSRARPRPGRQLPRAARDQHQQSRRQRDLVRAAGEGDRGLLQRLSHPGLVYARRRASSPTRRRPRPIAAPGGRRSCSSSNG